MTANIYTLADGRAAFTRRAGSEPAWHRLGGETPADAPKEVWARNAGMDFTIDAAPVRFNAGGDMHTMPNRVVLNRSDDHAPIAVVSDRFKVVQPIEILEFLDELVHEFGFTMDTAGVLGHGAKYWALATNDRQVTFSGDTIKSRLLIATACDGSMQTIVKPVDERVVCQNTMTIALREGAAEHRTSHRTEFDPDAAKRELDLVARFDKVADTIEDMASRSVSREAAAEFLWALFDVDRDKFASKADVPAQTRKKVETVWSYFNGRGIGADLPTARGTAWGLYNAVTQYVDHDLPARSDENRVNSAWFGAGAKLKDRAFDLLAA